MRPYRGALSVPPLPNPQAMWVKVEG